MVLTGHNYKEIQRKVRVCIIEDGKTPDECVNLIDEDWELTKKEKEEIRELAKSIGKK